MKFTVSERATLLQALVAKLQLGSTTKARKLIKHGLVEVNDRAAIRADESLEPGDVVSIVGKDERVRRRAPFEILFEDSSVLIAVKPAGILSVDRENENNTKTFYKLVNTHVRDQSGGKERVFLVHRLDRGVSGIMIFAKSLDVQHALENDWQSNDKLYYAIVEGTPPQSEGRIESWLAENRAMKVYSTSPGPDAKQAITHYRVVQKVKASCSLIEVRLETGRKNQIRVHLSDMGCPIVGDIKYGAHSDPIGRVALHAFRFAFNHPVSGERIAVEAPMPIEMSRIMKTRE